MGLLWGLYAFEQESTKPMVDTWKAEMPGPADVAALKGFIEDELWKWEEYLVRLIG